MALQNIWVVQDNDNPLIVMKLQNPVASSDTMFKPSFIEIYMFSQMFRGESEDRF